MINITPAILTNNPTTFTKLLNEYALHFQQIDIDINVATDNFKGNTTLSPNDIIKLLDNEYVGVYGIHLMVEKPFKHIEAFDKLNRKLKLYLHQEVLPKDYVNSDPRINIVVKAETNLKKIDFYNQFEEVQLMTIVTGKQGNQFLPETLEKVSHLRSHGYNGVISLDGSINLKTAEFVKNYDINRVSVGSFFSKSDNVELDFMKLNLALNMGRNITSKNKSR